MKTTNNRSLKSIGRLQVSLMLLLIALASISAATFAWFSIADNTRVQGMGLDITSGISMRFDLDGHDNFTEYAQTLTFEDIAARMLTDYGFDMKTTPLLPVTTKDAQTFTHEKGSIAEEKSGEYLTFPLHFIAQEDMVVHLTSEDEEGQKGTRITSGNPRLASAMRISFSTGEETYIYDPGMGNASRIQDGIKYFGLPDGESMEYSEDNAMFRLKAGVDMPVTVHIWLEGTDENCRDDLKGADYAVALKFMGTDEDNKPLDLDRYEEPERVEQSAEYNTKREETADEKAEEIQYTIRERWARFWESILAD